MRECFGGETNYIFRDILSLSLSPAAEVVRVYQAFGRGLWGVCVRGRGGCVMGAVVGGGVGEVVGEDMVGGGVGGEEIGCSGRRGGG